MRELSQKPTLDISVVIPVLGEAPFLEQVLEELGAALRDLGIKSEIFVASARRDEGLAAIVERCGARYWHEPSVRYAAAVMKGVFDAQGEYVLTMDPDAAYPGDAVRALWNAREEGDVIVASRYLATSQNEQPWLRNVVSRLMNGFFSKVLSTPVQDLTCGFRLYRRNAFEHIRIEMPGVAFLLETLLKLFGNGIIVHEVPFHYGLHHYRMAQAHGLQLGLECFRNLFRLWRMRNSVECADYDLRAFDSRIPLQRYWQRKRYGLVMGFVPEGVRTIDVGCGSGRIIADQPDAVGVDVRYSKLHYMRRTNRLLAQADGLHLPFADAAFRCVISSEVIEHIPDEDGRFLDELTRILEPGGTLVIGTPDYGTAAWPFFERLYGRVAPNAYAHEHVTHYTFATLRDALVERDYDVLDHGYVCRSVLVIQARKAG